MKFRQKQTKRTFGLYQKIMLTMFLVAIVPLLVVVAFSYQAGTDALKQSTGINFQNLSSEAALKATLLMRSELIETYLLSQNHALANVIESSDSEYEKLTGEKVAGKKTADLVAKEAILWTKEGRFTSDILSNASSLALMDFVEGEEAYHVALFITNKNGVIVSSINNLPAYDQSKSFWYEKTTKIKDTYIGAPYLYQPSGQYVFDLSTPLFKEGSKELIGYLVMHHEIQGFFQDVTNVRVGQTGHAMIANASGTILVCPIFPPLSHDVDPELREIITSSKPGWTITDKSPHALGEPNSIAGYAPVDLSEKLDTSSTGSFYVFMTQDPEETYSSPSGAFAPLFSVLIKIYSLAFVLMMLILFVGFFMTRRIVEPIKKLKKGAEILGHGDLDYRFNIKTGDEIEYLSAEFNEMAGNLKQSHERLKKWNLELESMIALRTTDLRTAVSQLERANKLKSEFLANISHELRTPLNSIIGFAELLSDRSFGDLNDKQLRYTDNIYRSGRQLLQLISELLDLSKIEAGQMALNITNFDIVAELAYIESNILPLAQIKNIDLTFAVPKDLPAITADENKFRQIMNNLLSNAIKFTDKNGKVSVAVQVQDEDLLVEVQDSGIGISDANKTKVFEEFKQVDNSYSREFGGTGLGLTLTKKFIEMHLGRIWLKSELEKGSTFFFTIPLKASISVSEPKQTPPPQTISETQLASDPSAASSSPSEQTGTDTKSSSNVQTPSEKNTSTDDVTIIGTKKIKVESADSGADLIRKLTATKYGTPASEVSKQKPLILVVEDDIGTSQLISTYLNQANYRVATAYDGDDAIKKAIELNPFAITLDIMLPKKSGWQVLQRLKETASTKDIPVVVISVLDDKSSAYQFGVLDYLVKPVNSAELIKRLNNFRFLSGLKRAVGMIVSDNRTELESLVPSIEENSKYSIVTANSGNSALEIAKNIKPEFIILDLGSQNINMVELADALRHENQAKNIPMILMSDNEQGQNDLTRTAGTPVAVIRKSRKFPDELLAELSAMEKIFPEKAGYIEQPSGLFNQDFLEKRLNEEFAQLQKNMLGFALCITKPMIKDGDETSGSQSDAVTAIGDQAIPIERLGQASAHDHMQDKELIQDVIQNILQAKFRDVEAIILDKGTAYALLIRNIDKYEAEKIVMRLDDELQKDDTILNKKIVTPIVFTYFDSKQSDQITKSSTEILSLLINEVGRVASSDTPNLPQEISVAEQQ